jgi:hypothetical protein
MPKVLQRFQRRTQCLDRTHEFGLCTKTNQEDDVLKDGLDE